jgi:hypothetical protein
MKNATLSWTLPTTRESGNPLTEAEILHVEIAISADAGANYSVLDNVPPGVTELLVPDLEAGGWKFHLTVVDTALRRSAAVPYDLNVPDETPPMGVTSVTAVLS